MDRGLFISASSASNLMEKLGIVTQNLANVSTVGFKKIMDQTVEYKFDNGQARLQNAREYGVTATPGVDLRSGAMAATGNPMNVALVQDAYLGVSTPNGDEVYTRRGEAMVDSLGVVRLPTGQALLGVDGGEIVIPAGFAGAFADDGTVWAQDPSNAANKQEIGRLKVVSGKQVSLRNDGFYTVKDAEPALDSVKMMHSGNLEQSNVSAADALAEMMEASRLYELHTKMMGTFSTMDQKGAELLANWQ
jgi:flagellar basal-body rod protein FlgF